MTSTDRADAYLTIPASYGGTLGGLTWSSACDAIERWNGTTLAFTEEMRDLLEGVFARPPVPPFAYVLTLLRVLRDGPDGTSVPLDRLWRAYTTAKPATRFMRNAGSLIAELCRGLPPAAGVPTWSDVALALGRRKLFGDQWTLSEEPALSREEFERQIERRIEKFDDAGLLHFLTHGCGPSTAGEKLADPVESLPMRVAKLVALARRRPRLVGAAALVAAVDAAFTLPPRRRSPDALPQGGYCDVTTRGEPDLLLPGQFALDRDEFVRRFAERELLYFMREEPQTAEKPDRIIVLDQGVRSWGSVRLALAAAALVLLKKDAKRVGRVRLVLTSDIDPIDVTSVEPSEVADRLEASDLTPHPAAALTRAVRDSDADSAPRDVVLLTHPRNVRERAVLAAARVAGSADRLFALTVDESGRAELFEWRPGGLVALRSFRVDLAGAEAARVEGTISSAPLTGPVTQWTGDVEPVGFPFRPGLVAEPLHIGFDVGSAWCVIAGREGVLHGLTFDDTPPEVLPRAFRNGVVLKQVDAVLGVADGVVVCGRMKSPAGVEHPASSIVSTIAVASGMSVVTSAASFPLHPQPTEVFVAAHYDRATRRVTAHTLTDTASPGWWAAFPDLHCVAVRTSAASDDGCAVDLATCGRFPDTTDSGLVSRARAALDRAAKGSSSPHQLRVFTRWSQNMPTDGRPFLYLHDNAMRVTHATPGWEPFEPTADGKPLLAGAEIHQAILAGDVLAVAMKRSGERTLVLFHGPEGRVLGEVGQRYSEEPFALSSDGRFVAYTRPFRDFLIAETHVIGIPLVVAKPAALHNNLCLRLEGAPFKLTIKVGGFEHAFSLDGPTLSHALVTERFAARQEDAKGRVLHPPTEYDPSRFPSREIAHAHGWRAVPDRLGQVLLFRHDGALAASFLVRRDKAAAWGADGAFWGDPALIGGAPTPDSARKIARAIALVGVAP